MEYIPLKMIRSDLNNIPEFSLPENYHLSFFQAGDEINWAHIETQAGEFQDENTALKRFEKEFGPYKDDLTKRCLFIETKEGEKVGTITAWYGRLNSDSSIYGRIHWVGIMPDYQGKKLAKPLLSHALKVLAQFHDKAYLTSQTSSYQAVNMYLNYGFQPFIENKQDIATWTLLEKMLKREIL